MAGSAGSGGSAGGDGSGGAGGSSGSPATGGSGGTVSVPDPCDDDFTDLSHTSLCWSEHKPSAILDRLQDTSAGRLSLDVRRGESWWNLDSGVLLYQTVQGDFVVEAEVQVHHVSGVDQLPTAIFAAAGLLIYRSADEQMFDPASNYYAIKVGTFDPAETIGVKSERTIGTASAKEELELAGSEARAVLRLCRVGNLVWTGYFNAGVWQEVRWDPGGGVAPASGYAADGVHGATLGDTVRVGLLAENYDPHAADENVRAVFEYARFRAVDSLGDCSATDIF